MKKEHTLGKIGEKLAINKFIELGLQFKCNIKNAVNIHDFDFIVNNKNVEVKTSSINKNGKLIFTWPKQLKKINQFEVLLCIAKIKENIIYFVIPREKIKSNVGISTYPNSDTKNWKYYSQFIDKWSVFSLSTGSIVKNKNCVII